MACLSDSDVLFRNDAFLAINKHPDLRINSNDPTVEVTVDKQLSNTFPQLRDETVEFGFRFAHRLDYATSGVLCVPLNRKSCGELCSAFAKRRVKKHYLALVRGHVAQQEALVDVPIGCDSSFTEACRMQAVGQPHCQDPRPAQTVVVRLEHGLYDGEPASKLLLIPHTGRTHQLRVHCSYIGHLIVGDYTYSGRQDTSPGRMMLHALRLVAPLPSGQLDISAPDPFLPETEPLWLPQRCFSSYQQACLRHSAASTATAAVEQLGLPVISSSPSSS